MSCAGWASKSRATQPGTCWPGCAAAASGRSCCARTWTRCRAHAPIEPVLVDGGVGERATTASSAPTTRPRWRCCSNSPGAAASRARRSASSCCSPSSEEVGLLGAKRFDATQLQVGVRLRLRPRDRDRRDRHRLADALPDRGRSSSASPRTPACARRRATRRSSPPPTPPRTMPHGRIDPQTTANLGYFHGGVESTNVVAERARLLAEVRSVDPDKAEDVLAGDDRRAQRRRQPRRVRRRRDHREAGRRLPPEAVLAGGRRRRGGAARARLRAETDRHRRRVGRQRLRGGRHPVRERRQRHRAQPRADRARHAVRAGVDARHRILTLLEEAAAA